MRLSQKTAKEMAKASKRITQTVKAVAKNSTNGIKVAVKTTISAVKTIVTGTKALIVGIIAGGWVAILIIIIVCLIAMISSSAFGIFFLGENNGSYITENGVRKEIALEKVISDLNMEFIKKITNIQIKVFTFI